jgi:hypothetical protein
MNPKYVISGLALALAFVPVAAAQKPVKPAPPTPVTPPAKNAITLDAKPSTIVFSGVTTLSGRLTGPKSASTGLRLWQANTRPYGDSYKITSVTATTDKNGRYSFGVKPLVNTSYRVVASTTPPVTSPARLVLVRIKVGINVSDRTPPRGTLVRFHGSVFPAHDGRVASIQRRTRTGSFRTVVRTRLRDAGTAKSTYSRRVRIFRDGVYRVKVAGDGDHINGFSRLKSIDVHR